MFARLNAPGHGIATFTFTSLTTLTPPYNFYLLLNLSAFSLYADEFALERLHMCSTTPVLNFVCVTVLSYGWSKVSVQQQCLRQNYFYYRTLLRMLENLILQKGCPFIVGIHIHRKEFKASFACISANVCAAIYLFYTLQVTLNAERHSPT